MIKVLIFILVFVGYVFCACVSLTSPALASLGIPTPQLHYDVGGCGLTPINNGVSLNNFGTVGGVLNSTSTIGPKIINGGSPSKLNILRFSGVETLGDINTQLGTKNSFTLVMVINPLQQNSQLFCTNLGNCDQNSGLKISGTKIVANHFVVIFFIPTHDDISLQYTFNGWTIITLTKVSGGSTTLQVQDVPSSKGSDSTNLASTTRFLSGNGGTYSGDLGEILLFSGTTLNSTQNKALNNFLTSKWTVPPVVSSQSSANGGKPPDNVPVIVGVTVAIGLLIILAVAGLMVFFFVIRRKQMNSRYYKSEKVKEKLFESATLAKPTNDHVMLEQLLAQDNFKLALAIVKCSGADLEKILQNLIWVLSKDGPSLLNFMKCLVNSEVSHVETKLETLFRNNSPTSKAFQTFAKITSLDYLNVAVGSQVSDLCFVKDQRTSLELSRESKKDSINLMAINVELDPSKMTESEDSNINRLQLQLVCQKLITSIFRSKDVMPTILKEFFAHTREATISKWKDVSYAKTVGSFLFLRFFCPALVGPHNYYITKVPPSTDAQRTLILLSKVLQNMCNGSTFSEDFMNDMNDFTSKNEEDMKSFFDQVSRPSNSTAISVEFPADDKIRAGSLEMIAGVLLEKKSPIGELVSKQVLDEACLVSEKMIVVA